MRSNKYTFPFRLLLLSILITALYGCDDFIEPTNYIIEYYASQQSSTYQIKTVALFPMAKDDTTDTGTFYSTNHFINRLEKEFPNVKFFIPSLIGLTDKDSLLIPRLAESIELEKKLNLQEFNSSELGNFLSEDKPDVMIIGKINNFSYRKGVGFAKNEFLHFEFRTITSCDFTYYLVSLADGNIIWKIRTVGEALNYSYRINDDYPPIDSAISNGIDLILDTGLPGPKNQ